MQAAHETYRHFVKKYGDGVKLRGRCAEASHFLCLVLNRMGFPTKVARGFFVLDYPYFCQGVTEEPHTWLVVNCEGRSCIVDVTASQFAEGCREKLPSYIVSCNDPLLQHHYREYITCVGPRSRTDTNSTEVEKVVRSILHGKDAFIGFAHG